MKITDLCTAQSGVVSCRIARVDCLTAIGRREERTILQEGLLEVVRFWLSSRSNRGILRIPP